MQSFCFAGTRVRTRVEKCFCSLSSLWTSSRRILVARPEAISSSVSLGRSFVQSVSVIKSVIQTTCVCTFY